MRKIEMGYYGNPDNIGYKGWIRAGWSIRFINLDDTLTEVYPTKFISLRNILQKIFRNKQYQKRCTNDC